MNELTNDQILPFILAFSKSKKKKKKLHTAKWLKKSHVFPLLDLKLFKVAKEPLKRFFECESRFQTRKPVPKRGFAAHYNTFSKATITTLHTSALYQHWRAEEGALATSGNNTPPEHKSQLVRCDPLPPPLWGIKTEVFSPLFDTRNPFPPTFTHPNLVPP